MIRSPRCPQGLPLRRSTPKADTLRRPLGGCGPQYRRLLVGDSEPPDPVPRHRAVVLQASRSSLTRSGRFGDG
ncbi:hypothetical protein BHM03_00006001 [Ensete ventricosum]|uniref:Uncharacterized protein n=1 Tax=Ensete ventricosum TaxID=4639 RepID=A0A445MBH0_ENSVE|nr:hypothetical protein BHM03_00006001 [Ensete ventricosum]